MFIILFYLGILLINCIKNWTVVNVLIDRDGNKYIYKYLSLKHKWIHSIQTDIMASQPFSSISEGWILLGHFSYVCVIKLYYSL